MSYSILGTKVYFVLVVCFVLWGKPNGLEAGETWFVDTRNATRQSTEANLDLLTVNILSETNARQPKWLPASLNHFLATHIPDQPLLIVIHGNLMTATEARQYGLKIHQMSRNVSNHRLLVWSWPADRVSHGPRKDALAKAYQADYQAKYLVAFLRRLPAGSKVSLVGFSFGGKVICETLERLATSVQYPIGCPIGLSGGHDGHNLRIRGALLEAAMDQDSLRPGRQYGNAMRATEKMLIHVDRNDETLFYYPLLTGLCGPQAIGRAGMPTYGMPTDYLGRIRTVWIDLPEHLFINSFRGLLADKQGYRNIVLFEGN